MLRHVIFVVLKIYERFGGPGTRDQFDGTMRAVKLLCIELRLQ